MNTPICDFVRRYAESENMRLHMPGHKGTGPLGIEALDITEIDGADSLYEASGIIAQSEANASRLFGCPTYYSTEGSSLCIRAMLYMCTLFASQSGRKPIIAAGRNVHRTFLTAAAMLDFEIEWLYPNEDESYLSCTVDAQALDTRLSGMHEPPAAVYLTSPDYLGNVADIRAIAEVCHRHGCLLVVDNAHGAYLRFLGRSAHPIDLGADMCCDSAHKTLPVLTGGAYLHISSGAPKLFREKAKDGLALFGSTSPSYLILQSLDAANRYLARGYCERLAEFVREVGELKARLAQHGYTLCGAEPLKLTIDAREYGYDGRELARLLLEKSMVCEFSDSDFVVMMLTPETGADGLEHIEAALRSISRRAPLGRAHLKFLPACRAMSVRQAMMSASETIPVSLSIGRIYAEIAAACPPAVPIVVCGERIDHAAAQRLAHYGIEQCRVIIE